MKENPNPNLPKEDRVYEGDEILKRTGDVSNFKELEKFSWETIPNEKDILLQGAPSQIYQLHASFFRKEETIKNEEKEKLIERYGNESDKVIDGVDKEVLEYQNETYIEYNLEGKIVGYGRKKIPMVKSKYEEDIFVNKHTSVWG